MDTSTQSQEKQELRADDASLLLQRLEQIVAKAKGAETATDAFMEMNELIVLETRNNPPFLTKSTMSLVLKVVRLALERLASAGVERRTSCVHLMKNFASTIFVSKNDEVVYNESKNVLFDCVIAMRQVVSDTIILLRKNRKLDGETRDNINVTLRQAMNTLHTYCVMFCQEQVNEKVFRSLLFFTSSKGLDTVCDMLEWFERQQVYLEVMRHLATVTMYSYIIMSRTSNKEQTELVERLCQNGRFCRFVFAYPQLLFEVLDIICGSIQKNNDRNVVLDSFIAKNLYKWLKCVQVFTNLAQEKQKDTVHQLSTAVGIIGMLLEWSVEIMRSKEQDEIIAYLGANDLTLRLCGLALLHFSDSSVITHYYTLYWLVDLHGDEDDMVKELKKVMQDRLSKSGVSLETREPSSQVAEQNDKRTCQNCGNVASDTEQFKACSACRRVHYCSVECQKKHWPRHKTECKK